MLFVGFGGGGGGAECSITFAAPEAGLAIPGGSGGIGGGFGVA